MRSSLKKENIIEGIKNVLNNDQFSSIKYLLDTISENTSFVNDLGLDSIQILELIVGIENEFNITCSPDELDLDLFDNFKNLINFIQKKT